MCVDTYHIYHHNNPTLAEQHWTKQVNTTNQAKNRGKRRASQSDLEQVCVLVCMRTRVLCRRPPPPLPVLQ